MQTLRFDVRGMTYGGCTHDVQRVLSKLDGVSHAEVSLRPGIATVVAYSARVTPVQNESALAKLDYDAKVRQAEHDEQGQP